MKEAATPEKLAEIWTSLQGQLGAYKRRAETHVQKEGPYDLVFVTTGFERQAVDLKVVVSEAGEVVGFFIEPAGSAVPPPDAAPPPYAQPGA